MAAKRTTQYDAYAFVWWVPADLKVLRPTWSTQQCTEHLLKVSRSMQDAMLAKGWEVLEKSLPK